MGKGKYGKGCVRGGGVRRGVCEGARRMSGGPNRTHFAKFRLLQVVGDLIPSLSG